MARLSVEECRKYLPDLELTDKQIESIRDKLTILINIIFDKVLTHGKST